MQAQAASLQRVATLPGARTESACRAVKVGALNGKLYFALHQESSVALDPATGPRPRGGNAYHSMLFATDGTSATAVASVGAPTSQYDDLVSRGIALSAGVVLHTQVHASLPTTGPSPLWFSDGTGAGTSATTYSADSPVVSINGMHLFAVGGKGLYSTDGSKIGTALLWSSTATSPRLLYADASVALFLFYDSGYRVVRTDGTLVGTKFISSSLGLTSPQNPFRIGNQLYFETIGSSDLSVVDLTTGQWTPSIAAVSMPSTDLADVVTSFGGKGLLATPSAAYSTLDLWVTDGATALGSEFLGLTWADQRSSAGYIPTAELSGRLYIAGLANGQSGLYQSDLTKAGTASIKTFAASKPIITSLVSHGSRLLLTLDDGTNGEELWESDGTTAGTSLVGDVVSGKGSSSPRDVGAFGDDRFYVALDGTTDCALYKVVGILPAVDAGVPADTGVPPIDGAAFEAGARGPAVSGDSTMNADATLPSNLEPTSDCGCSAVGRDNCASSSAALASVLFALAVGARQRRRELHSNMNG